VDLVEGGCAVEVTTTMDRALVFNCPCQLARLKYQRKYEKRE